ncbi:MAG: DUF309 domain-containing protein [Acidobacteria bacterium]|nr:DUF309 domain-containing protein [Acidobacteriota bacterium]
MAHGIDGPRYGWTARKLSEGDRAVQRRRFYECHEVLEEIWLRAEGTEREFLHALIQAAAALHHDQRGNLKGAEGVFTRAKRNFDSLPRIVMRLDIPGFVCLLEDYLAGTRRSDSIVNPPLIQLTDKNHD